MSILVQGAGKASCKVSFSRQARVGRERGCSLSQGTVQDMHRCRRNLKLRGCGCGGHDWTSVEQ